jgi:hypothetical protein
MPRKEKKTLALIPIYDAKKAKILNVRNSALNLLLLVTKFLDNDITRQ